MFHHLPFLFNKAELQTELNEFNPKVFLEHCTFPRGTPRMQSHGSYRALSELRLVANCQLQCLPGNVERFYCCWCG